MKIDKNYEIQLKLLLTGDGNTVAKILNANNGIIELKRFQGFLEFRFGRDIICFRVKTYSLFAWTFHPVEGYIQISHFEENFKILMDNLNA